MTWHIQLRINLVQAIIRHQKLLLTCKDLPTVALSIPCKNQKQLLTSTVVFAVNRYECLMENKNLIRTFCGCKPSKETKLASSKFY